MHSVTPEKALSSATSPSALNPPGSLPTRVTDTLSSMASLICDGEPVAMTRPCFITATLSQICWTSQRLWLAITTVLCFSLEMKLFIITLNSAAAIGSRPAVGSSKTRTAASLRSALQRRSFLAMPVEYLLNMRFDLSARPTISSRLAILALATSLGIP